MRDLVPGRDNVYLRWKASIYLSIAFMTSACAGLVVHVGFRFIRCQCTNRSNSPFVLCELNNPQHIAYRLQSVRDLLSQPPIPWGIIQTRYPPSRPPLT